MTGMLNDVKKALGIAEEYEAFDPDIIMFINATLADLNQIGVGPTAGFSILDQDATWEEFLGEDPRFNSAQAYMHISVRMLFDPPEIGFVLDAMQRLRDEAAWRLSIVQDELVRVPTGTPDEPLIPGDPDLPEDPETPEDDPGYDPFNP